jgi:hypothetical protein
MMEGKLPLCTLCDGTRVGIADVQAFYAAIPDLSPVEREALVSLLDDAVRLREFGQFVHMMYRMPGFVIPYP